ncbi:outer membrane protein, heavy metal efflux system [Methylococcus capsulatus]|uniref:Outer membrane protein, heavy metal efflux system n=1 Tax=Methylococcus capsulatus TaxID=414 RepID=A0AA35UE12_METCP|nr:TolC family protein [Methylococcus capsulatus]CAI8821189.1 outer membrane protein, heavy metal efflux system [Methylococcus capsulatus]
MFTKFTVPAAVALTGLLLFDGTAQGTEMAVAKAPDKAIAALHAPKEPALASETVSVEEPAGDITLMRALAAALLQNPELAAFSQEIRAREAAVLQAGLLPNPRLGGSAQNFGNASNKGFDGDWMSLDLSQLIELGGKRAARIEAAERTRELAGWDYEVQRIVVLTLVSQTFTEVLGAQARLDLARQTAELAEQVATTVGNQVKAGEVSPVEETRAKVALATVRTDLTRAERELEAARRRLAALWGSVEPRFAKARGELESVLPIPTLEQLQKRIHQNPELARWSTELAQRQALVDLEKTKAIPDVTVSLGMSEYLLTHSYGLVAGVSLPLPVFDRNQGRILEAERRRTKAMEEQRTAEVRVATALNTAYQALAAAFAEAEAYKTSILPGAESAYEAVRKGYRLGQFTLLDVLDTQRTLFAARAQYLRALTAYHQAVAEVERLIGERLTFVQNSEVSK